MTGETYRRELEEGFSGKSGADGHRRSMIFGVEFSAEQNAALADDEKSPRWDLNPPQREEYDSDRWYALALRQYADRLIARS